MSPFVVSLQRVRWPRPGGTWSHPRLSSLSLSRLTACRRLGVLNFKFHRPNLICSWRGFKFNLIICLLLTRTHILVLWVVCQEWSRSIFTGYFIFLIFVSIHSLLSDLRVVSFVNRHHWIQGFFLWRTLKNNVYTHNTAEQVTLD
jgi:hypothetical protein